MTTTNQPSCVILVGCGSIGKKYLHAIRSMNIDCVVVDPKFGEISENWKPHSSKIIWVAGLELIPKRFLNSQCLAVIANWGPDHFESFNKLVQNNLKMFIIEKPVVSRYADLLKLKRITLSKEINVVVNQGWESNSYPQNLLKIFEALNLGELKMMVVHGGARCISTAGSHYIHVAQRLFQREAIRIKANLLSDNINPRDKSLSYLEGNLTVEFENKKLLSINFSNSSSIEGSVNLYWRNATAVINQNNITINQISANINSENIVTRYSSPDNEIFNSSIVDDDFDMNSAFENLLSNVMTKNDKSSYNLSLHLKTSKILLYGLVSSQTGKTINIVDKLTWRYSRKDFRIS